MISYCLSEKKVSFLAFKAEDLNFCFDRKSRFPTHSTAATRTSRARSTRRTYDGCSTTAVTSSSASTFNSTNFYDGCGTGQLYMHLRMWLVWLSHVRREFTTLCSCVAKEIAMLTLLVNVIAGCSLSLTVQQNVCLLSMYWNICVVMICALRLIQTGAVVYKMNM